MRLSRSNCERARKRAPVKPPSGSSSHEQRRALLYVFDGGTGIGHLRRMAAIARHMQGPFACLLVTGHRAAAQWFVPPECEYVHLPAWDSLVHEKAQYWSREPFILLPQQEAVRMRSAMLMGVVQAFRPDVVLVDHLPLGMREELRPILRRKTTRFYLVTRGVQNESEDLAQLIFGGDARAHLHSAYHRILAAIDPQLFNFPAEYGLEEALSRKTIHTGYVADEVDPEAIARARAERNLATGQQWVVASAGGGQHGEALVESCYALAKKRPEVAFDIVAGPRSRLCWGKGEHAVLEQGNLRLHRETPSLPMLNRAADVVVTSGGYNTLIEALQGSARVVCIPNRKHERDEQFRHAALLAAFVTISVSNKLADLERHLDLAIRAGPTTDRRRELDVSGAERIARIVAEDLRMSAASTVRGDAAVVGND